MDGSKPKACVSTVGAAPVVVVLVRGRPNARGAETSAYSKIKRKPTIAVVAPSQPRTWEVVAKARARSAVVA